MRKYENIHLHEMRPHLDTSHTPNSDPLREVSQPILAKRASIVKYAHSEKGRIARARYEASDAAKERNRRARTSAKGKLAQQRKKANRLARNSSIVSEAKSRPCVDCGGSFDPVCMDFHHIEPKKFDIGRCGHYPTGTLKAEIAKCMVICSNCHRLRHKLPTSRGRTPGKT